MALPSPTVRTTPQQAAGRIETWKARRPVSYEPRRAEPFHDAWMAHAADPHMVRLAHAIVAQWLGSRLVVEPDRPIMGRLALKSIVSWSFHRGVSFNERLWHEEYAHADAECSHYLQQLADTWRQRNTGHLMRSILTPLEAAVMSAQAARPPGCHGTPLHVRLAEEGTPGLRAPRACVASCARWPARLPSPPSGNQALEIIIEGFEQVSLAYANAIRLEADQAQDAGCVRVAARTAPRALSRIIRAPSTSFPDALQALWLSMHYT